MHLPRQVYRLCDTLVDDVVCVSDDEIREAIRDGFEDTRALLEPAGALTCSLWLRLLTIGCAYLLWLCLLLMAVLTRRLLGGGTCGYRLPCIRLQAAMHTVTGATSIAGLKKWAAQQPAPGADGAASAQYVAVASDACNIEFDFLGRPACSHVPRRRSSTGSGGAGHLRLEAPPRWPEAEPGLRGQREPWPCWVGFGLGVGLGPLQRWCCAASLGRRPVRRLHCASALDPPGKVQSGGHSIVPSIGDLSRHTS